MTDSWFRLTRKPDGGVNVVPAREFLVDVNDAGSVEAASRFAQGKQCGSSGSTCFLAPSCSGGFVVAAPNALGFSGGYARYTFVRLDGTGKLAWIEQDFACSSFIGNPPTPPLQAGLHNAETMVPLAAAGVTVPAGSVLANRAVGRRMVVESRGALLRNAGWLQWWSAGRVASGGTQRCSFGGGDRFHRMPDCVSHGGIDALARLPGRVRG